MTRAVAGTRRRWAVRLATVSLAAVAAGIASSAPSPAALKPVRVKDGVTSPYRLAAAVRPARHGGRRVTLVRTVRLFGTRAGVLRIQCRARCVRRSGPPMRIVRRSGDAIVTRLNLLLTRRQTLTIKVVVPSARSHYIDLVARKSRVRVVGAGCLTRSGRRVACPARERPVDPKTPTSPDDPKTPTTPDNPKTPNGPQDPKTPTPQGVDPIGGLQSARRVAGGHIRVMGWAQDSDAGSSPITVRVLARGVEVGTARADVHRDDVGARGFDTVVRTGLDPAEVCVEAINVGGGQDKRLGTCHKLQDAADFDGSGYVACPDMNTLLSRYGQVSLSEPADLNGDGNVNAFDLSLLLSRYKGPPGEGGCETPPGL